MCQWNHSLFYQSRNTTISLIYSFTAHNSVSVVLAITVSCSGIFHFLKVNIEIISLSIYLIVKSHSCTNNCWERRKNQKHLKTIPESLLTGQLKTGPLFKIRCFFSIPFWQLVGEVFHSKNFKARCLLQQFCLHTEKLHRVRTKPGLRWSMESFCVHTDQPCSWSSVQTINPSWNLLYVYCLMGLGWQQV